MIEKYQEEKLELINKERIDLENSKEYILGRKIFKIKNILKNRDIKRLKKIITNNIHGNKVKVDYKENNDCEFNDKIGDVKIAVYTSVIGNYDEINDNFIKYPKCDYFIISEKNRNTKNWNWIDIIEFYNSSSPINMNRFAKMNPSTFFKEKGYDYSIYIDGNIDIISNISCFINQINPSTGLAFHHHNSRNCVYDEANSCIAIKKGNKDEVVKFIEKLNHEKFPRNFGLFECNVIVSDLNNDKSKRILDAWWNEFLNTDVKRDQLIFPYVLWKLGYKFNNVGYLGNNVYKNYKLHINNHI